MQSWQHQSAARRSGQLTIENGRATLLELVDEDGSLLRKESL